MSTVFEKGYGSLQNRLDNFEKYIRRQTMTRFLARYELFKLQANIKGSIVASWRWRNGMGKTVFGS